mmetsp:Transcript_13348/g.28297  ORF Transcript_13348/g.28297 Transcript_13348/m.28297 type:complete len:113 (+) Transcript_13348:624-962(+)
MSTRSLSQRLVVDTSSSSAEKNEPSSQPASSPSSSLSISALSKSVAYRSFPAMAVQLDEHGCLRTSWEVVCKLGWLLVVLRCCYEDVNAERWLCRPFFGDRVKKISVKEYSS